MTDHPRNITRHAGAITRRVRGGLLGCGRFLHRRFATTGQSGRGDEGGAKAEMGPAFDLDIHGREGSFRFRETCGACPARNEKHSQ